MKLQFRLMHNIGFYSIGASYRKIPLPIAHAPDHYYKQQPRAW